VQCQSAKPRWQIDESNRRACPVIGRRVNNERSSTGLGKNIVGEQNTNHGCRQPSYLDSSRGFAIEAENLPNPCGAA